MTTPVTTKKDFCENKLKPWIFVIVAMTAVLITWVFLRNEDMRIAGEMENLKINNFKFGKQNNTLTPKFDPNQVGPIFQNTPNRAKKKVAFQRPISVGQNNGVSMRNVALTNNTPNANPSQSVFQNSLRNSVSAILPSVCDIHAMWTNRAGLMRKRSTAKDLLFVPPFDGVIDRYVMNKGYENIGSGVIVDEKGFVLTNYHVVKNATNIVVTVGTPSRDYLATIVAQDKKRDLALLKINAQEIFPAVNLGNSNATQIGDYVIAFGSPFGMEQTVTSGIISGMRKSIVIEGSKYGNLFQTDTPINQGSSGGPLANLNGEVIGVATAIYAPTGVFSGTGFVIPINEAKQFLSLHLGKNFSVALNNKGRFQNTATQRNTRQQTTSQVQFGVEAIPLDPIMAKHLGAIGKRGVLVNKVFVDSPASAFIQRGDIITSIAGISVSSISEVGNIMSRFKNGDNVNMQLIRNGQVDVVLVRLF